MPGRLDPCLVERLTDLNSVLQLRYSKPYVRVEREFFNGFFRGDQAFTGLEVVSHPAIQGLHLKPGPSQGDQQRVRLVTVLSHFKMYLQVVVSEC